jgi:hypothetical protein
MELVVAFSRQCSILSPNRGANQVPGLVSFAQRELIFAGGKDCPLHTVGITLSS